MADGRIPGKMLGIISIASSILFSTLLRGTDIAPLILFASAVLGIISIRQSRRYGLPWSACWPGIVGILTSLFTQYIIAL